MDISKQAIGAFYIHTLNLIFAEYFSKNSENSCEWLFFY